MFMGGEIIEKLYNRYSLLNFKANEYMRTKTEQFIIYLLFPPKRLYYVGHKPLQRM